MHACAFAFLLFLLLLHHHHCHKACIPNQFENAKTCVDDQRCVPDQRERDTAAPEMKYTHVKPTTMGTPDLTAQSVYLCIFPWPCALLEQRNMPNSTQGGKRINDQK